MNQIEEYEMFTKNIYNEGYRPRTIAFAIMRIQKILEMSDKYDIMPAVNLKTQRPFEIVAEFICKILGPKSYTLAKWLLWLQRLRYILKPIEIYKMDGRKLYFNWLDNKSRYIFEDYKLKDMWEPETTKIVKGIIKPGDVCLDIGASIGYFTLLCASLGGTVYAFEPMSRGYKYLVKNIKVNGYKKRAKAFQLGAWDKSEIVGMPRCDDKPIPVQCVSVSEHLEKLGVTKVDFIKIDIDGSEPWAFKGLIPLFEKNPQMKMVCEYYPHYIENAGGNPQDMMDIVDKYFTKEIIPGDYVGDCVNYFCIRKT